MMCEAIWDRHAPATFTKLTCTGSQIDGWISNHAGNLTSRDCRVKAYLGIREHTL